MIIDTLNGVLVVNEQEKPEFKEADKEWEANCKPVENVTNKIPGPRPSKGYPIISTYGGRYIFYADKFPMHGIEFKIGQQVQTEEREGKIYVTKIKQS